MTKRRSLDDALTPEENAFLVAGAAESKKTAPPAAEPVKPKPPAVPATPGLVALNLQIQPTIMAALLRASSERKIQRIKPYTQRDIVSEAVTAWLKENNSW